MVVFCNSPSHRHFWIFYQFLESGLEVFRSSLVELHEVHILAILIENLVIFVQENVVELLLFLIVLCILLKVVLISAIEGIVVLYLVEGLLDIRLLEQLSVRLSRSLLLKPLL